MSECFYVVRNWSVHTTKQNETTVCNFWWSPIRQPLKSHQGNDWYCVLCVLTKPSLLLTPKWETGLVPQMLSLWFSGRDLWHRLILGVLSGLSYRLGKTGMDGKQSAKSSPCFLCLCLVRVELLNGSTRHLGHLSLSHFVQSNCERFCWKGRSNKHEATQNNCKWHDYDVGVSFVVILVLFQSRSVAPALEKWGAFHISVSKDPLSHNPSMCLMEDFSCVCSLHTLLISLNPISTETQLWPWGRSSIYTVADA